MRPWRSKTPAERSPVSRTEVLNIPEPVEPRVETRTDDGRRLVFCNHGRPADARSRRKITPPINIHLPELAGLGVEEQAPRPRLWLARPFGGRCAEVAFRRRAHGGDPAQYLDLDAWDGSTVEPAIGRLEQLR